MKYPGFCGDSYTSQSRLASAARTVNLYPEIVKTEAPKAKVVLYPTPGVKKMATAPAGRGRGGFSMSGRALVAFGTSIHEFNLAEPHTLTLRGTVAEDQYPVTMAASQRLSIVGPPARQQQQVAITSGNKVYILDLATNAFTGPVLTGARMVVFLNGYFVVLDPATSDIKLSDLTEGLAWNTLLRHAVRQDAADPWRALAINRSTKDLWLIGEHTGSIYYDAGTSPMPLQPREGVLITPGIIAPFTLRDVKGAMMWLAHSHEGAGTIVKTNGYSPEVVSTEAVHTAFARYEEETGSLSDAVAWSYEERGHVFYVINFPTADATWVYDLTTNWWHERGTYDGALDRYNAWGPQYHFHEAGKHYVVDHVNGNVYEMAIKYVTDTTGRPLRRLRIAPGLADEQNLIFYDELRLYLETGLGTTSGDDADPMAMLRVSRDGGKTFGAERWRSAGAQGHYQPTYLEWRQLGSATDAVFSFSFANGIPWRIIDAYLEVRQQQAGRQQG